MKTGTQIRRHLQVNTLDAGASRAGDSADSAKPQRIKSPPRVASREVFSLRSHHGYPQHGEKQVETSPLVRARLQQIFHRTHAVFGLQPRGCPRQKRTRQPVCGGKRSRFLLGGAHQHLRSAPFAPARRPENHTVRRAAHHAAALDKIAVFSGEKNRAVSAVQLAVIFCRGVSFRPLNLLFCC